MSLYFTVIYPILYSPSPVQHLGSLTDQHAHSTAEMGTHKGRSHRTQCELPWKPRHSSRVHPDRTPRSRCLPLDASLGQCVPAICATLHTTTRLLLTIWKIMFNIALRMSHLGTWQEQSLKFWWVRPDPEEMAARSPAAGTQLHHNPCYIY